jgi:DNA modification methylase
MTTRILVGDVRARLADIPDASVHCVVTSPPYYGLRDYQTADWSGGDAGCDHMMPVSYKSSTLGASTGGRSQETHQRSIEAQATPYRSTCGKCGAVRVDRQIGLEPTLAAYIATLVDVFRGVRRVLRDDGTVWLNLGDSYAANRTYQVTDNKHTNVGNNGAMKVPEGMKPKDLMMVPARVAIALQQPWLRCRGCNAEHHESQWATFPNGRRICPSCELSKGADASEPGFYLRSDIIWAKPNPMPESVQDRPTSAHEHVFLLSKSSKYFYDAEAIREPYVRTWDPATNGGSWAHTERQPNGSKAGHHSGAYPEPTNGGANKRNVWTIATTPFPGSHFATFPPKLVEPMILAGTSEKGCCPQCGSPWVRQVEREASTEARHNHAGNGASKNGASRIGGFYDAKTETLGWSPSCACPAADPVPCTVLDPFGGAGTVGLVADRLGRDAILIELNPEYAQMASARIKGDAPMFAGVEIA